jgi:hypothetical protein
MLVKKPSDLLLQLELTSQVTHRSGIIKELPLNFSGKIVPLHDHGRAETGRAVAQQHRERWMTSNSGQEPLGAPPRAFSAATLFTHPVSMVCDT